MEEIINSQFFSNSNRKNTSIKYLTLQSNIVQPTYRSLLFHNRITSKSVNMDVLTDPRFSPYLNTTTVTKYFPRNNLSQSQAKHNPIYKFFKENQNLDEQEKLQYKRKVQTQQNLRRSSISMSETKFIRDKTIQRVRTMNSIMFENNNQKNNNMIKKKKSDNKGNEIIKFNSFSYGVERFQKSLDKQKQKCLLLKKYNKIVEYHFDKFQPNEDRSRCEIVQHQNIIRLLLNRQQQKIQRSITNCDDNEHLDSQQKRKQQLKLSKQKQLKQIVNSKHCQQKVHKVINNYLKDLSHNQSNKIIHKKCIKQRTFTQQKQIISNTKSLYKLYNIRKSISSSQKNNNSNSNKENMIHINLLKVPQSMDFSNLNNKMQKNLNNKMQKTKMRKLSLSKHQNNNYFPTYQTYNNDTNSKEMRL